MKNINNISYRLINLILKKFLMTLMTLNKKNYVKNTLSIGVFENMNIEYICMTGHKYECIY